jgi:hypothetical protein
MSQLFAVRHRNGMWWDGLRYIGNRAAGERWQRHIGIACLFTRRSAAAAVARRTGARVFELVPTP